MATAKILLGHFAQLGTFLTKKDFPNTGYEVLSLMLQSFLPLVYTKEEKSHMLNGLLTTAQNEEDDEPQDGPQHYILLLGFYQPHLIVALDAIGVHVANVIRLCSGHTLTSEGQQEQQPCEGNEQSLTASPALDAEVHGSVELAVQARKLDLFRSGVRPALDSGPLDSKLHDVVQLSYTVPDLLPPLHAQVPEAEVVISTAQSESTLSHVAEESKAPSGPGLDYELLSLMLQSFVPLVYTKEEKSHMLNGLLTTAQNEEDKKVVQTPLPLTPRSKKKSVREESQPDQKTEQPPLSTDVDMRYYSTLLDLVPPEACSVSLIMHCLVEQVVISTAQSESTLSHVAEESKAPSGPGLDYELLSLMLQSFLPLVYTKEEKSTE